MTGLRGGRSSRQPSAGSATATDGEPAAAGDAAAGSAPAGRVAKKSRSVFGPEPASRPDILTHAETVVMASLKGPTGTLDGLSPKAGEAAANARDAVAVKQQATTPMVPVGTSAAFSEAVTQMMPTIEPSALTTAAEHAPPRRARAKRDRPPTGPQGRYTAAHRTTMISQLLLLAILSLQAVLSLRLRNTAFERGRPSGP